MRSTWFPMKIEYSTSGYLCTTLYNTKKVSHVKPKGIEHSRKLIGGNLNLDEAEVVAIVVERGLMVKEEKSWA